jgi:hypothetical protein
MPRLATDVPMSALFECDRCFTQVHAPALQNRHDRAEWTGLPPGWMSTTRFKELRYACSSVCAKEMDR